MRTHIVYPNCTNVVLSKLIDRLRDSGEAAARKRSAARVARGDSRFEIII